MTSRATMDSDGKIILNRAAQEVMKLNVLLSGVTGAMGLIKP